MSVLTWSSYYFNFITDILVRLCQFSCRSWKRRCMCHSLLSWDSRQLKISIILQLGEGQIPLAQFMGCFPNGEANLVWIVGVKKTRKNLRVASKFKQILPWLVCSKNVISFLLKKVYKNIYVFSIITFCNFKI